MNNPISLHPLDYFRKYRLFHGFGLMSAGAVAKIGSSLKSNHHKQIKLAPTGETHCTIL